MTDGRPALSTSSRPRPRARQVARQRRGRRARRGPGTFIRDLVIIIVVAFLASFLIKTYLVRSFYIPSPSMNNTLQVGDRILVDELVPGLIPIARGDVIVFKDPGDWLEPDPNAPLVQPQSGVGEWLLSVAGLSKQDANDHLIKRVIGLPGDQVTCCNALGQMSVNGTPLSEPYVKLPAGTDAVSEGGFSEKVPANSLWVMGDNRYDSKDSRYQLDTPSKGFVPINDVVGRAFVISWPLTRWSYLSNYPKTFNGVAPAATSVKASTTQ